MSKIALEPNAAGTGTFTIAAPNGNNNQTFTLPNETGTILTTQSAVDAAQITGALNASGSAPIYACRAWVNFNGTGTVDIRSSGNVSSITDLGVGQYRVNFTSAMPDANYAALASGSNDSQANYPPISVSSHTTTSVEVRFANNLSTGTADQTTASVAIFR